MKKIMFNDQYGLTAAVLEGRKTMTRRIAYTGEVLRPNSGYLTESNEKGTRVLCDGCLIIAKSFYKVGEVVAVAQRYSELSWDSRFYGRLRSMCERLPKHELAGWDNKMFVRADLMQHQIRITNVRVERLQDITAEDCLREGVYHEPVVLEDHDGITYYASGYTFNGSKKCYNSPRNAFAALIDKISGKGTWKDNPYVFAYEFELVK